MDARRWQVRLFSSLVLLSVALYALRWLLFPGPSFHNEMWRFLVGDIAFLLVQVPLVTLLIDRQLQRRQREEMLNKLNMVIGAFFSEAGTSLLGTLASADKNLAEVRSKLIPSTAWTAEKYSEARDAFVAHDAAIDLNAIDLTELRDTLGEHKRFLLGLLGNPNLLEHESFTDLLWALTHLAEELAARDGLTELHQPDAVHLSGDVKRAYTLLGREWLGYVAHLQAQYPYLFSLAVRTNPLDPEAEVVVTA